MVRKKYDKKFKFQYLIAKILSFKSFYLDAFSIIMLIFLFGIVVFHNRLFNVFVVLAFTYFAFLIFGLVASFIYLSVRRRLIIGFNTDYFDDYLEKLINKYNYQIADILIYALWRVVANSSLLYEMFISGKYINKEDKIQQENEIQQEDNAHPDVTKTKRGYIIVSFLRCITFQLEDRTARIPAFLDSEEKMVEVFKLYYAILKKKNIGYDVLIKLLKSAENTYTKEKIDAVKEKKTGRGKGNLLERIRNFSIDETNLYAMKYVLAISSLIFMIFHCFYKGDEFNDLATFLFEGITVLLLFVDVAKYTDNKTLY